MRLKDKVALITGAARSQGALEARLFAQEGAKVIVADLMDDEGKAVVEQIIAEGGDALYCHLDVTSEADWQQAIEKTISTYGKLNVLVNNAGILKWEGLEDTSLELWNQVINVNQTGVFLGMKHSIPAMRQSGGGSIINISSIAGLVGMGHATAYQATKGAIRILTKSAAIEYAKENIRINSVHPGVIDTKMMTDFVDSNGMAKLAQIAPLQRLGRSEDVAKGVLFLASDDSDYMTGSELVIDGGYTAQ
jgi:NAD(P)-dependent dehydrogenase (short-subunit alcohol dehydrogenase family)